MIWYLWVSTVRGRQPEGRGDFLHQLVLMAPGLVLASLVVAVMAAPSGKLVGAIAEIPRTPHERILVGQQEACTGHAGSLGAAPPTLWDQRTSCARPFGTGRQRQYGVTQGTT